MMGNHKKFFTDFRDHPGVALLALDLPRPKASRASQVYEAVEAPLSGRSEFGGRASSTEKHRVPIRQRRIG